jgi:hypothetical protein
MKITVVTLYRGDTADYYVGAVAGSLTNKQRLAVAERFNAKFGCEEEDDDEERRVYFREVDMAESVNDLTRVQNIDDEDYNGDGES